MAISFTRINLSRFFLYRLFPFYSRLEAIVELKKNNEKKTNMEIMCLSCLEPEPLTIICRQPSAQSEDRQSCEAQNQ